MAELTLREHEVSFPVKPVGVKYICEFCNQGEMIAVNDVTLMIDAAKREGPVMIPHRCTLCGKDMLLPRTYPRIEFVPIEEQEPQPDLFNGRVRGTAIAQCVMLALNYDQITHDFFMSMMPALNTVTNMVVIENLMKLGVITTKDKHAPVLDIVYWTLDEIPSEVKQLLAENSYTAGDVEEVLQRRGRRTDNAAATAEVHLAGE